MPPSDLRQQRTLCRPPICGSSGRYAAVRSAA